MHDPYRLDDLTESCSEHRYFNGIPEIHVPGQTHIQFVIWRMIHGDVPRHHRLLTIHVPLHNAQMLRAEMLGCICAQVLVDE